MSTTPMLQRCQFCGADWWDAHVCPKLAPSPASGEDKAIYESIAANYHDGDKARQLLRRALRQLQNWQEKYGEFQPAWLPPAGDVRLAEDIAEFLGHNVEVTRRHAKEIE